MKAESVPISPRVEPEASGVRPWTDLGRFELAALGVAVGLYLCLHAWILVLPTFGEPDGARLAGDAASFHFSGVVRLEATDYRMRTSPLYIHALKRLLDAKVATSSLPRVMSWLSCVSSGGALAAAYLLFRRITGRTAAAVGVGLLACAPAFWLAGGYGMAHGPGLALWLSALLSFALCLEETVPRRYWIRVGVTTFLVFLALGFKADLVLNGLAFPGLAFVKRKLTLRHAATACGAVLFGMGAQILYVKAVVSRPLAAVARDPSTAEFAVAFNKRFPFSLDAFSDRVGFSAIDHAAGPFLFSLGMLAIFAHLVSRSRWRLGLFAVAWGLPIVLFWGFQIGNSARHNLSSLPPMMLLLGSLVSLVVETPLRVGLLAVALAGVNYFSDSKGQPDGFGTVVPITNLLELSRSVAARSQELENWARGFARAPGNKAIIARSSLPFAVFEELVEDGRKGRPSYDGREIRTRLPDGSVRVVTTIYQHNAGEAHALMRKLRADGNDVWRRD